MSQSDRDQAMRDAARRSAIQQEETLRLQQEGTQNIMNQYLADPTQGFTMYGTPEELRRQASQLSLQGALSGYNINQTGAMAKEYGEGVLERYRGDDLVAQQIKGQRNRNLANVARQSAGRGVAGAAAAAASNQAQMEADAQIAAQMQGTKQAASNDLRELVRTQQRSIAGAIDKGTDVALAESTPTGGGGIFGKGSVVCTELKRQGLLPHEVWAADHNFGMSLAKNHPDIWEGYHTIAAPIISGMQKSKLFTKIVAKFAVPWAYHVAGQHNAMGELVMKVGLPLCKIAYKIKYTVLKFA